MALLFLRCKLKVMEFFSRSIVRRVSLMSAVNLVFFLGKEERWLDQFLFPREDVDRLLFDEKIVRVHSAVI